MKRLYCIECGKSVNARLTNGAEIYPYKPSISGLPFWKCDRCGNYVGCHHKTVNRTRPLGNIPNPAMREARRYIHDILDPIWKLGAMSRSGVYDAISSAVGFKYHTAELRTIEDARRVYYLILKLRKGLDGKL